MESARCPLRLATVDDVLDLPARHASRRRPSAAARQGLSGSTPCEVCHHEAAYSFAWFPDRARWYAPGSGTWKVTGSCTAAAEHYYIPFARWTAEQDWLKHLRAKLWFDEGDFLAAVSRVPMPEIQAALRRQVGAKPGMLQDPASARTSAPRTPVEPTAPLGAAA
jgi:hypothetical protein